MHEIDTQAREGTIAALMRDDQDLTRDQAEALYDAAPDIGERLESYYARQIDWSAKTFGPAKRTGGVVDHIRKELREIEVNPTDLSEWVDVIILAMDGFWRHGGSADTLMPALLAKQKKNMARVWPDWRTMSENVAIEHDRSHDATPADDRPPIVTPDHLKPEIEIILAAYRGVSLNIADRLINAGLENGVAANLAICAMMTEAARTGALFAHAFEKREPRRDWWLISAAEHFDAAGQWYAEAFGKAATEVDGQ